MRSVIVASALASIVICGDALAQAGRDYVYIVGSSTVYPFATVVAERFGRGSDFKTPKVESTGSGGGLKLFCDGIGVDHPDIANASRAIKQSEVEMCASNGVAEIIEVKIGYDGIVVANAIAGMEISLSRQDIFLALAKEVPGGADGDLIKNPYQTWQDVNSSLPAQRIEVLGPPPTSGTRDAFVELAMEGGCKTIPWIAALKNEDGDKYKAVCHTIREDGLVRMTTSSYKSWRQTLRPSVFLASVFLTRTPRKLKALRLMGPYQRLTRLLMEITPYPAPSISM
jgi:phosphate transport system substrate-binding protein